jgi:hypothetical protein
MTAATALRLVLATSCAGLAACGPRAGTAPAGTPAISAAAALPRATGPAPLAPLREEEKELAKRLSTTVGHLAGDIGERNVDRAWNLASATDDLAITLEKIGFSVRRQGVRAGDDIVQNLEVRVPGGEKGRELVVVGAHFDSAKGSPGADAGASGAAAVLELARSFQNAKPSRALCFTLFVNGEAPHHGTPSMGALQYAKDLLASGLEVKGMIALDGIGAYSTVEGSQKTPEGFAGAVLPEGAAFPGDHWAFEAVGVPAVLVTDTGAARSPHPRQKTDVPANLDFDRMARVVTALQVALREYAE